MLTVSIFVFKSQENNFFLWIHKISHQRVSHTFDKCYGCRVGVIEATLRLRGVQPPSLLPEQFVRYASLDK